MRHTYPNIHACPEVALYKLVVCCLLSLEATYFVGWRPTCHLLSIGWYVHVFLEVGERVMIIFTVASCWPDDLITMTNHI